MTRARPVIFLAASPVTNNPCQNEQLSLSIPGDILFSFLGSCCLLTD
jgi:hypothetical protein